MRKLNLEKGQRKWKLSKKSGTKLALGAMILSLVLAGCSESEIDKQTAQKVENANVVMAQTQPPVIKRSLERENISQRIKVSNDPNTLQWIYPISAGRVIGRFPVKGKVTSGGKRLTPTSGYNSQTQSSEELPDEMATYGNSGDYIFWFDPAGQIHQWKGDYFVSPVPYQIDKGYGTISVDIDNSEQQKIGQYQQQIKDTNEKMNLTSGTQNNTQTTKQTGGK